MKRRLMRKCRSRIRASRTIDIYRETICKNKGINEKKFENGVYLKCHRLIHESKLFGTTRRWDSPDPNRKGEDCPKVGEYKTRGLS